MADPHREWGDVLPADICELMRLAPHMIGVGISCQQMWRTWGPDEWDDDQFNAAPKLYRTRKAAERMRDKLIRLDTEEYGFDEPRDWTLTLWVAPEHEWSDRPADKYLAMTGHKLPGSPRH